VNDALLYHTHPPLSILYVSDEPKWDSVFPLSKPH
jgi:hypothetical protein